MYTLETKSVQFGKLNEQLTASNHPPLYYYILHPIKVWTDGQSLSLVSGYTLNFIFWILSVLTLLKLLNLLFESNRMISLTLMMYSMSFAMISTTLLIKAYALQEWLIILLIYLFSKQGQNIQLKPKDYLIYGLVCTCAFLTHYYSYPIVAGISLIIAIHTIFIQKQLYRLVGYGVATILAIGLAILIYPNIIDNILENHRSIQIQDKLADGSGLAGIIPSLRLLQKYVFVWPIICIASVGMLSHFWFRRSNKQIPILTKTAILLAVFGIALYHILLYYSPYNNISYVSPVLAFLYVGVSLLAQKLVQNVRTAFIVFLVAVTVYPIIQLAKVEYGDSNSNSIVQSWNTKNDIIDLDETDDLLIIPEKLNHRLLQPIYYSTGRDIVFSPQNFDQSLLNQREHVAILLSEKIDIDTKERITDQIVKTGFHKKKSKFSEFEIFVRD